MSKSTKRLLSEGILWASAIGVGLSYIFLACMMVSCSPSQKQSGYTAISAMRILTQSADKAVDNIVEKKMGDCARANDGFESDNYKSCMKDAWKLSEEWNDYVEPALISACIAATSALSIEPEKETWLTYVKKGVCLVSRLFTKWKKLIPYSEMISPIMKTLGDVSCDKPKK